MAETLKTNKTLEEVHVGNLMVGCKVRLKSSGKIHHVRHIYSSDIYTTENGSNKVNKSDLEHIPAVLPAKQLRENTIETLDFSNKGLGVDGGLMLAALMAGNNSTQYLDVSRNALRAAGAKGLL